MLEFDNALDNAFDNAFDDAFEGMLEGTLNGVLDDMFDGTFSLRSLYNCDSSILTSRAVMLMIDNAIVVIPYMFK